MSYHHLGAGYEEAGVDDREALVARLVEALEILLNHYTELVCSGDAGFWDPEKEAEIIAARSALAAVRGEG